MCCEGEITKLTIEELEQIAREGARRLEESGYTYDRVVEDVSRYINRLRERRWRRRLSGLEKLEG